MSEKKRLPGDALRAMAETAREFQHVDIDRMIEIARDIDRVHETNVMLIAGQEASRRQVANLSRQQTEGQMELAAKVITESVKRMLDRYEGIRHAASRVIVSRQPPGNVPTEVIDTEEALTELEAALVAFEAPHEEKADGQA